MIVWDIKYLPWDITITCSSGNHQVVNLLFTWWQGDYFIWIISWVFNSSSALLGFQLLHVLVSSFLLAPSRTENFTSLMHNSVFATFHRHNSMYFLVFNFNAALSSLSCNSVILPYNLLLPLHRTWLLRLAAFEFLLNLECLDHVPWIPARSDPPIIVHSSSFPNVSTMHAVNVLAILYCKSSTYPLSSLWLIEEGVISFLIFNLFIFSHLSWAPCSPESRLHYRLWPHEWEVWLHLNWICTTEPIPRPRSVGGDCHYACPWQLPQQCTPAWVSVDAVLHSLMSHLTAGSFNVLFAFSCLNDWNRSFQMRNGLWFHSWYHFESCFLVLLFQL